MESGRHPLRDLLLYTVGWAVVLASLITLYNVINWPSVNTSSARLLSLVVGAVGLFLPLVAFAGGVAAHEATRTAAGLRSAVGGGLIVAGLSLSFLGYLQPLAEYRADGIEGRDVETRAPFGPDTPGNMLEWLRHQRAYPPAIHSYGAGAPFAIPANWIEHLFHRSFAVSLFGVLGAMMGSSVGRASEGRQPGRRTHIRWAAGIAYAWSFLLPAMILGDYTRTSPEISGVATAWAPLLIPLLLLVGVNAWLSRSLARRERSVTHVHG